MTRIPEIHIKCVKRLSLLCIFILLSVITAKAQEQKITLSKQTLSAKEAIVEIKNQTGYYFAINHTQFDDYRVIYFPKKVLTLREALTKMVEGTNLTFQVKNKQILILALEEESHDAQIKTPDKKITGTSLPAVTPSSVKPVPTSDYRFEQEVREYTSQIARDNTTHKDIRTLPVQEEKSVEEVQAIPYPTEVYGTYMHPAQEKRLVYTKNEVGDPKMLRALPAIGTKVNVLYGVAALAPNVALEIGLSRKTTLDLSVAFNLWKDEPYETKKMVHLIAKPEFRYWLCERFNGHFFGIHPFYWDYNVSGKEIPLLFDKEYRYEGHAFGVGASYGYHWMWGKRWGMEFNIGAGGAFLKYKKFDAEECGEKLGNFRKKYVGPTSAGIKIMFLIK